MFDGIINFFKKFSKENKDSKDTAKERLHLVLMQDRANVSADFLEMMKQEIIEVIKKYIDVDENSIDVKLTNKVNSDGTTGAPALYANIPIMSLKDETKKINIERKKEISEEINQANEDEESIDEIISKDKNDSNKKEENENVTETLKKENTKEEQTEKQDSNDEEIVKNKIDDEKENNEDNKKENNEIENKDTKSEEHKEEEKEETQKLEVNNEKKDI